MIDAKGLAKPLSPTDLVLIGVAAAYWPLWVLAANFDRVVHPERLLGLAAAVWTAAGLVAVLAIRLGTRRSVAVNSTVAVTTLVMSGGALTRELGSTLGLAVTAGGIALSIEIFRRLGDSVAARAAVVALVVALGSGPGLVASRALAEAGSDDVRDLEPLEIELIRTPDIFLVFLDGYPGKVAMAQDMGLPGTELSARLEARGFEMPASTWTSYWSTQYAIPSVLEMGYPVTAGGGGGSTVEHLYRIVAGDNTLVELLKAHGYTTYAVESGWPGSRCGPDFDNCVSSPLIDEAMFVTLRNTVAEPWLTRTEGPFTSSAQNAMDWLLENGGRLSQADDRSFVFAHMVAPHPPLFLDENCESVVSAARSGATFYLNGVPEADRNSYFLEQLACLDGFMHRFDEVIEPDDVVVFVSDHGTDRRYQVTRPAEHWTTEEIIERMNVFLAVRTGVEDCSVGDSLVTANLMRRVFDCYSPESIPDNEPRVWVNPMIELDSDVVMGLLAME